MSETFEHGSPEARAEVYRTWLARRWPDAPAVKEAFDHFTDEVFSEPDELWQAWWREIVSRFPGDGPIPTTTMMRDTWAAAVRRFQNQDKEEHEKIRLAAEELQDRPEWTQEDLARGEAFQRRMNARRRP